MHSVLVVDDNVALTRMMIGILENELPDARVMCCGTAKELRSAQEKEPFDLIVLDCMLPDADGAELLDEIQTTWPETELILISGNFPDEMMSCSAYAEVCAVLSKPFEPGDLVAAVFEALDLTRTTRCPRWPNAASSRRDRHDADGFPGGTPRHRLINNLSRILSGLRAFEADLRADFRNPDAVLAYVDEYVDRIVESVHEMKDLVILVTDGKGADDV